MEYVRVPTHLESNRWLPEQDDPLFRGTLRCQTEVYAAVLGWAFLPREASCETSAGMQCLIVHQALVHLFLDM